MNGETKDLSVSAKDIILPFLDIKLGKILLYTWKEIKEDFDAGCIIIMLPDTYDYTAFWELLVAEQVKLWEKNPQFSPYSEFGFLIYKN